MEWCVKVEESSLGIYVANSDEKLISGVASAGTINTEDTVLEENAWTVRQGNARDSW